MWPSGSRVTDWFAVGMHTDYCSLGWIQSSRKNNLFVVKDLKKIPLLPCTTEHGTLFNHSHVKICMNDFISRCSLQKANTVMGLADDAVYEEITSKSCDELAQYIEQDEELAKKVCAYQQLCQCNGGNENSYLCAIAREQLFQYHLLLLSQALNVVCVTTSNMAYLNLLFYDQMYVKSQIAVLSDISKLVNLDELSKFVTCEMDSKKEEMLHVAELVGLCIAGENV